ncbi:1-deoxy-D-xylulose 5-phosphate reductoisomerase [Candidatus Magnetoovum chiemensis]|nr:1-deoxy-D-xylulose 5-phosphate reductoisomerase [Candidatus Magnetoovum chiemensis]
MKNITILGSTGSIGRNALDVIATNKDQYRVCAITANKSAELLKEQIVKFKPDIAAVAEGSAYKELSQWIKGLNGGSALDGKKIKILGTIEGLCEAAAYDKSDFVISSIVGASGLLPTLSAIRAGKDIGLANKETLVMAGEIVIAEAQKHNVKILPVDSEHSAIFQCLEGSKIENVRKLILTASGGPFFGKTAKELTNITPSDALKHPNWSMGSKVTIDSATLMNKGLEIIEAHHLFGFPEDRIDVIVHPQSIVHSLVEFKDGCMLAQLSVPDMKAPISYALSYPNRIADTIKQCRLTDIQTLSFHKPDMDSFPCLKHAYSALKQGGTMPAVLNAANEELVQMFLNNTIGFTDIPTYIEQVMEIHKNGYNINIENIFEADAWARRTVIEKIKEARK